MTFGRHVAPIRPGRGAAVRRSWFELVDVVLPASGPGRAVFLVLNVALGVLVLVLAVTDLRAAANLEDEGMVTTAVVVEPGEFKSPWLDVEFTTADGVTHRETTTFQRGDSVAGETITVEYVPDDPSVVAQANARTGWTVPGIWGRVVLAALVLRVP